LGQVGRSILRADVVPEIGGDTHLDQRGRRPPRDRRAGAEVNPDFTSHILDVTPEESERLLGLCFEQLTRGAGVRGDPPAAVRGPGGQLTNATATGSWARYPTVADAHDRVVGFGGARDPVADRTTPRAGRCPGGRAAVAAVPARGQLTTWKVSRMWSRASRSASLVTWTMTAAR
jgi:hypothetical protein